MNSLRIFSLVVPLLLSIAIVPTVMTARASADTTTSELDPISAGCYSCHDGSSAPRVLYCTPSQLHSGCYGHPVSVSYGELASQSRQLQPLSSLPPELVLYQGKITCVTCHGPFPHDGEPFAMDNSHSALCRACHLHK
jgi:hypothetical protein